jgi:uncharacterized protein YjiS (DUF1127 family)
MAYVHQNHRAQADHSFWQRAADLRSELLARVAKYRAYRATLNELGSLNDRDLADLGLHRAMIADVAREAAYKA